MFRLKKPRTFLAAFTVASALLVVAAPSAQDDAQAPPSLVTDLHRWLAEDAGVWDAACVWYGPEGEVPFQGKETVTVDLGGLWSFATFEAEFMGAPFTGRSCTGYDVDRERFVGAWVDSTSTRMILLEGERQGDALVLMTEGRDPMTGATYPERHVHTRRADGARVFEMFRADAGAEPVKLMRIVYTRAR